MQGLPFYTTEKFKLSAHDAITTATRRVGADYFNTDSLLALIDYLVGSKYMFRVDGVLTWCKDIRFNYRDRFIYIPYYTYDIMTVKSSSTDITNILMDVSGEEGNYITSIPYNLTLKRKIIDDRRCSYRSGTIDVYNPETGELFEIDILSLPYTTDTKFSMDKLLYFHKQSIFYPEFMDNFEVDKDYLSLYFLRKSKYKRLATSMGLKLFSEQCEDFRYQDIRQFKVSPFSEEYSKVDPFKSYPQRRYEFESYLYVIFAQGLKPEENEYLTLVEQLGVSKRFISLGEVYPLILKYYYKNGDFKYTRKTYEYYEVLK